MQDEHGNYCLTRPLTLAADGTAVVVRVSTVAGSMGSGVDAPAATAAASDRAPGQPLGAQAAPGLCSGGVRRAMDARGADEPSDLGTGVPSTCTAAPSCSVARHAAAAVAPAAPGALRVQAARALTAHEEQQVFTQVRCAQLVGGGGAGPRCTVQCPPPGPNGAPMAVYRTAGACHRGVHK